MTARLHAEDEGVSGYIVDTWSFRRRFCGRQMQKQERPRPALHRGLSKDMLVCEYVLQTLPVPAPSLLRAHLKAVAHLPSVVPSLQ